jgi:opacity protein-like surface antigen
MRKVCFTALLLSFLAPAAEARVVKKCYIKPCEIKGDFNGDGKIDRATLVENGDGQRGIQIKVADGKIFVIGAGNAIGSGGANFDWMDHWEIHHGAIQQGVDEGKPPKVKGDSLLLEQTNSASGIVYWNGSGFAWYQQGD